MLEDCYNAAPESVQAALDTLPLLTQSGGRRMALLGDMKELGTDTVALHRAVGAVCAGQLDCLWTVGALGAEIAAGGTRRRHEPGAGAVPGRRSGRGGGCGRDPTGLAPGDTLLIKASRAMHPETVAEALLRGLMQGNL